MTASKSELENLHSGQVFLSHSNVVKCDDGLIVSNLTIKCLSLFSKCLVFKYYQTYNSILLFCQAIV